MPDRAAGQLAEIERSCARIRAHLTGVTRESFLVDLKMRLQVIGEAVRNLLEGERAEAPEIVWTDIVAFRHRVAHDYRHVDFEVAWGIVERELAPLDRAVRRMLAARGEAPP